MWTCIKRRNENYGFLYKASKAPNEVVVLSSSITGTLVLTCLPNCSSMPTFAGVPVSFCDYNRRKRRKYSKNNSKK